MVPGIRPLGRVLIGLLALASAPAHAYFAVVNSTDHTEMHVVPAPGKVTLDGDLKDWDLSGAILMKLDESSQGVYSVRGAMMYDAEALYIGAYVKDPTPMVNHYAFADDPGMAWNADAVQVRFVSDPALKSTASLQSGGSGLTPEQARHICHLTLWYSSRDQKPGFFICYTLGFSEGLLNPPAVAAAYSKDADGKGYTFEYRIPWAVLRAPRPLAGGDQVQLQWQLHWGNDIGQGLRFGMTDVRNPASGDLGYMGPACWGTGVFEKAGHLKLAEKAAAAGRPKGHIPIPFRLERDAKVSLAVCDSAGQLVRTCLGAQPFKAGEHTHLWDGLDDTDQALPAAKYTAKLLTHDGIRQRPVCDVGVSGTPPYQTEDGTGGWAGDYRCPWYVAAEGERVVLGTGNAEAAPVTIATDLDGKKLYGTAALGNALVLHKGFGYFAQNGNGKLLKFELAKGYLAPFSTGKAEATILQREPKESKDSWGARSWTLNAMAVVGDTLAISGTLANKLYLVDLASGAVRGEADLKAPFGLATDASGVLYAVSENAVGRFDLRRKAFTPIAKDLDAPRHLACDREGNVYVSLQGKTHQVWKLSRRGRVLRKFGKPGGRPSLGAFDPAGMLSPYAIAVDRNGRLWVAEADSQPRRYSVWNADGSLHRDFFGSLDYATRLWADPEDPRQVYAQCVRYRVDYEKGTWAVDRTWLRPRIEGKVELREPSNHAGGCVVNLRGRKFVCIRAVGYNAIHEAVGDQFVPRLVLKDKLGWLDRNNDGQVQDGECFEHAIRQAYWGLPFDSKLNLYTFQGEGWAAQGNPRSPKPFQVLRWEFKGFNDKGGLEYADPKTLAAVGADRDRVAAIAADGSGNTFVLLSGGTLERGTRAQGSGHRIVRFGPDGKVAWQYQNVHCAFAWTSEPYFPGYVVGAVGFSEGFTKGLLAVTGYYGQYFLLDKEDGLFVDALGEDQRSPYTLGPHIVLTENFNGTLFENPKDGKVYFSGGDADARIWDLVGLDSIRKTTRPVEVTEAMAAQSKENARAALAAELSRSGKQYTVKRLRGAAADGQYDEWANVKPLPIVLEAGRSALAQLGYDEKHLYVRFQVADDSPLRNTPTDYKLLFKTGDAVEVQLGADSSARQQPTLGDLRLILSRTPEEKMVATLYRPKTAAAEKPDKARFQSPTGQEDFDEVAPWNDLPMHCAADREGYVVEAAIPWARLGVAPKSGMVLVGDVGVIFGNQGGTRNAVRFLWADRSPEVSINNDVPSESRIHPAQWGKLVLE